MLVSVRQSGFSPVEPLLRETAGTASSSALHVGGRTEGVTQQWRAPPRSLGYSHLGHGVL